MMCPDGECAADIGANCTARVGWISFPYPNPNLCRHARERPEVWKAEIRRMHALAPDFQGLTEAQKTAIRRASKPRVALGTAHCLSCAERAKLLASQERSED